MMPLTALGFSLVAALLVQFTGRRDIFRAPRITAVAITLLLAFPLLNLLPKISVLPAAGLKSSGAVIAIPWHGLWLAGAVVLLLRLLSSGITLARWRRESERLDSIETGRRRVEIRCHPSIKGPMAAGVLKPAILVPQTWQDWQPEVREMVLAHELAHHRRLDPLWRLLGAMACALHWFNPLVWWLVRRHATLSEFACDAMVIRSGVRADSYANLLCDLAQNHPAPQPAAPMSEPSTLGARVSRLMSPGGSISPGLSAVLTGIVVIAAIATAVVRQAEQEPVPVEEVRLRLSADPFPGNP